MRFHRDNTDQLLERLRLAQARREGRITDDELHLAIQRGEHAPSPLRYRRVGALVLAACVAAAATAAYF